MLRNFGRPVQSVALSPDYKNDRSFLSGGRAGELILTTGGRVGATSNSTTMGGAAATASSWLGSMGLASNSGKDTIIHSGEGAISTIRWSLSGQYVAWVNEEGIKIMRSNLHLDSSETEFAWKRISHIDRPNRPGWDEMSSVWKARAEWIDQSSLDNHDNLNPEDGTESPGTKPTLPNEKVEKLVVGWGGTVWVIDVYPERASKSSKGERLGSAEVVTMQVFGSPIAFDIFTDLTNPDCELTAWYRAFHCTRLVFSSFSHTWKPKKKAARMEEPKGDTIGKGALSLSFV